MLYSKWSELQNAIIELPFPPPYQLRYITDETDPIPFNGEVKYLGDYIIRRHI
jgi:hypothetical protein